MSGEHAPNREVPSGSYEIEAKVFDVQEKDVRSKLRVYGAHRVAERVLSTVWFTVSGIEPPPSVRIRTEVMNGHTRHFFTIKTGVSREGEAKTKREIEGEASSVEEARIMLAEALQREYGLDSPPTLEEEFSMTKTRVSYMLRGRRFKGTRFDFDAITAVNGKEIPESDRVHILEIERCAESDSDEARASANKTIRECAEHFYITLNDADMNRSTKAVLKERGLLE